jgi:3-phenylpropionate/trans-cinnamate dioxygenase ferredoxin reductase subunit
MVAREVDHLLIGGGIASATAALTIREAGGNGSILLVGRELDPPYHRPPLSKGYLQGRRPRNRVLIRAADWWERNGIELCSRVSVTELDPAARTATLSNKQTVSYQTALIATGALVRRLNVEGAQLDGIHYLRTLANADTIRDAVDGAERVVLIGGSYIGCEVAASLTELGKRCTIVMQESVTLERAFGRQAGRFFQRVLEDHGIAVFGDDELDRFEGSDRVERVITKAGRRLDADVVVLGSGALPDVMLARKSGLELGDTGGVRATARLETAAPGLYAAGDMCEYESMLHGRRLRIEHEDVAAQQGRTVGMNMLGAAHDHDAVPYFFSDLSDWVSLGYVGPALSWDTEVIRGSPEDGAFSIWYLERGRLAAALSVGRPRDLDHARRMLRRRGAVDAAALADIETDLAAA